MNKIRQLINKDDGKMFQVGNENLNYVQIIGYGFMILALLSVPVRQHMPELPIWITVSAFAICMALLFIGERKRRTK